MLFNSSTKWAKHMDYLSIYLFGVVVFFLFFLARHNEKFSQSVNVIASAILAFLWPVVFPLMVLHRLFR